MPPKTGLNGTIVQTSPHNLSLPFGSGDIRDPKIARLKPFLSVLEHLIDIWHGLAGAHLAVGVNHGNDGLNASAQVIIDVAILLGTVIADIGRGSHAQGTCAHKDREGHEQSN